MFNTYINMVKDVLFKKNNIEYMPERHNPQLFLIVHSLSCWLSSLLQLDICGARIKFLKKHAYLIKKKTNVELNNILQ